MEDTDQCTLVESENAKVRVDIVIGAHPVEESLQSQELQRTLPLKAPEGQKWYERETLWSLAQKEKKETDQLASSSGKQYSPKPPLQPKLSPPHRPTLQELFDKSRREQTYWDPQKDQALRMQENEPIIKRI